MIKAWLMKSSVDIVAATGGTVYTVGDYKIHKFTSDGDFIVSVPGNVEILVIAGGGSGGGGSRGGAGGAGGLVYDDSYPVTAKTYTIQVGAGGVLAHAYSDDSGAINPGTDGESSIFDTITAVGGGGGGDAQSGYRQGRAGGSGGGAYYNGAVGDADYLSPRQGYDGGAGATSGSYGSGGGGGAGGVGGNATTSVPGDGGPGVSTYSDLLIAAEAGVDIDGVHWIAGGGSGANYKSATHGAHLHGGGGGNLTDPCQQSGTEGLANTGGGGGAGGNGGSGIVIIKYKFQ